MVDYQYITTSYDLKEFAEEHQDATWIAFDTEFISEKRYYPKLCLIQVASDHGYYLIDPFTVYDLQPFLDLITNPQILKITHAGSNDYRLFYQVHGILPQSVFDVQIAAGFIGHRYPLSLDMLLHFELKVTIDKGQKVSDWAERPMSDEQITYALYDVIYLKQLKDQITQTLQDKGRLHYALEEMRQQLEDEVAYQDDLISSIAKSTTLLSLPKRSLLFYIRLSQWRNEEARLLNVSKNMVLDKKMMAFLTKNIQYGIQRLRSNRRAPRQLLDEHADRLTQYYQDPITPQEQAWLDALPKKQNNQSQIDLLFDQIDLYLRYISDTSEIDSSLILSRTELNKMKLNPTYYPDILRAEWRKQLLGPDLLHWLAQRRPLHMTFQGNTLHITPTPQ